MNGKCEQARLTRAFDYSSATREFVYSAKRTPSRSQKNIESCRMDHAMTAPTETTFDPHF
jgi:hypothetical protein